MKEQVMEGGIRSNGWSDGICHHFREWADNGRYQTEGPASVAHFDELPF